MSGFKIDKETGCVAVQHLVLTRTARVAAGHMTSWRSAEQNQHLVLQAGTTAEPFQVPKPF